MRVYLQLLMATLIFNDIWYPEQVSKKNFLILTIFGGLLPQKLSKLVIGPKK